MSLFQEGREYSTINTNRSMLSVTLPPVDGSVVGKHPIICRFMQGIFNSCPPKPRYSFVCNVNTVIFYMDTMPPNEKLSLKDLSAKLVILMALCNADRSSDLIALDLNFRQYTSAGVSFTIPELTKTRRAGQPIQSTYPSFPENAKLCPVPPYDSIKTELPHLGQRIQETTHCFCPTVSLSNQLAQLPLRDG